MKKLLCLLLALLMLLSLAACGNTNETPAPEAPEEAPAVSEAPAEESPKVTAEVARGITVPPFTVKINDVAVTNETLAACEVYSVQSFSVNSSGTETVSVYVGFALSDVLAAVGIADGYTTVEAIADDGYSIEYSSETAAEPTTLLAVTRDGEQFKEQPWFAPCSSETSGDYLKRLAEIRVDAETTIVPETGNTTVGEAPAASADLPEISDKTDKVTFADFRFRVNGEDVTNETLKDLHIYKITVNVVNSKGNPVEDTYTGYRLSDVLAACGVSGYAEVLAVANDGYESKLTPELADSEYCLIAIEKNKETGEDGTIWVAPCDQTESKAYAKLVVEIKTAE